MKFAAKQIAIVFVLLLFIESISWLMISPTNRTHGFLIHQEGDFIRQVFLKYENKLSDDPYPGDVRSVGFTQIDPLLGYSMPEKYIQAMGYETVNNTLVLRSHLKGKQPIKIYVTGDATTDVALHRQNWPYYLSQILEQQGICADVYVGGVGGYGSGQQLLKIIRDAQYLKPDIYISYSGANEVPPSSHTSAYENEFYEHKLSQANSGTFMPNMMFLFKKKMGLILSLHKPDCDTLNPVFWLNNMKTMHGIALQDSALFIGVLAPVLGSGTQVQPKEMDLWHNDVARYSSIYPVLKKGILKHPDFLYDMSGLFDTINDRVFIDDCHLADKYQPLVAQKIITVLRQRKYL